VSERVLRFNASEASAPETYHISRGVYATYSALGVAINEGPQKLVSTGCVSEQLLTLLRHAARGDQKAVSALWAHVKLTRAHKNWSQRAACRSSCSPCSDTQPVESPWRPKSGFGVVGPR